MAKKKATKPSADPSDKARIELRFDQDVFEGIRNLADSAGISVNQLMHGLARWAIANGHAGDPVEENGFLTVKRQPGCVFFGEPGQHWQEDEKEDLESATGKKLGRYKSSGKKIFVLDFTERRVVRED